MVTRVIRLIILVLLVALAVSIVVFNREPVTFAFLGSTWEVSVGVLGLTLFAAGVFVTAAMTLMLFFAAKLRERRLAQREKALRELLGNILQARSLIASGEQKAAQVALEKLQGKGLTGTLAALELATALERRGSLADSLRILDEIRAADSQQGEALVRAAALNEQLGNLTAALDNLRLLLESNPALNPARDARRIALLLGRPDDALRFHRLCEELGEDGDSLNTGRAQIALAAIEYSTTPRSKDELADELKKVLRDYPDSEDALIKLASVERDLGRSGDAAQHLIQAAKLSGKLSLWHEAMQLWLRFNNPDKAIAAARSTVHNLSGSAKLHGELSLALLLLTLHRTDEALDILKRLVSVSGADMEIALRSRLAFALALHRSGDTAGLVRALTEGSGVDLLPTNGIPSLGGSRSLDDAPSPTLSTP